MDDKKVSKVVNNISNTIILQKVLERMDTHCTHNKLDLNVLIRYYIDFTQNIISVNQKLKICNLIMNNSETDLGVIHDSKLLFNQRIFYKYDKV